MMNWLDIVLAAIVIFSALVGWQKGLVRQLFDLVGVIASYLVAIRYGGDFINRISEYVPLTEWFPRWFEYTTPLGFSLGDIIIRLIGFAVLFGLVSWLFRFAGTIAHGIFSLPILDWVNGMGGLLFGSIQGVILALIVIAVAKLIGTPFLVAALEESSIAGKVLSMLPVIYKQMSDWLLSDLYTI